MAFRPCLARLSTGWPARAARALVPKATRGTARAALRRQSLRYGSSSGASCDALLAEVLRQFETADGMDKAAMMQRLHAHGFGRRNRLVAPLYQALDTQPDLLSADDLLHAILGSGSGLSVQKALDDEALAVTNFAAFREQCKGLFEDVAENRQGEVASYIPELAAVDPERFAMSITTVDGQQLHLGDCSDFFCVQSCSKPITYCMALEEHGRDAVHEVVGWEPSGRPFNAIDSALRPAPGSPERSIPWNPMVNAGAIAIVAGLHRELQQSKRLARCLEVWAALTSTERLNVNTTVYMSEEETADRNRALAYMMRESSTFGCDVDIDSTLELYFQLCSIDVNTQMLSDAAATLANGGVNPMTKEPVFQPKVARDCLSLMLSCGMYDFSGQWAFSTGCPAKSGVSGALMVVVPNLMGIAIWSPRLDAVGNSVRGVDLATRMASRFDFHLLQPRQGTDKLDLRRSSSLSIRVSRVIELLFAAANDRVQELQQLLALGVLVNASDYDGRTALHLACAEGHLDAVCFLLDNGADPALTDRWGQTALDEARRNGSQGVIAALEGDPSPPTTTP